MDEFKSEEGAESSATSPRWTGAPSIALAEQVNEQCIELVCELATASSTQELPPFVSQNRDLWRLLEPDARKRVAAFPFVIVDLRFKDAELWREVSEGRLMSSTDSPLYTGVPPRLFEDLALETLLFARQAAREDVNVAKAMFAMTSAVASLVASLSLSQIRAIASANTSELKVRWDNDPEFWRDLLIACRASDAPALAAVRRHAKLLFSGELIPTKR
jgi:hypothetical protein